MFDKWLIETTGKGLDYHFGRKDETELALLYSQFLKEISL